MTLTLPVTVHCDGCGYTMQTEITAILTQKRNVRAQKIRGVEDYTIPTSERWQFTYRGADEVFLCPACSSSPAPAPRREGEG